MDKEVIIAVVLAVLILVSLFQTFQLVGINNRMASGAGTASLSAGSSSGETYEQMMERMHGSGSSSGSTGSSSGSAMVGGC